MRCFIISSLLAAASLACAEEPSLLFQRSGKEVGRLSAAEISRTARPGTVKFFDPHHGKIKSYRCWPVKAVMEAAYGPGWEKGEQSEAVMTALDGYASVSSAAKLVEQGGCLAFEDLDVKGWEPIGRKKADPGPFYLVWTGAEQSTANEYPWPWQLASVNLVRFEERYPEVVPTGAAAGSPERRGYMIFRGQCLRCHAINQQGGRIGPDLNAPQSVVSYRSKKMIKEFIRKPSKYRYTEMPDHEHLSDRDLEDLYRYFRWKSRQPEKTQGT